MIISWTAPAHDGMRKCVSRRLTPRPIGLLQTQIPSSSIRAPRHDGRFVRASDYVAQFGALMPPVVIGGTLRVSKRRPRPGPALVSTRCAS